MIKRIGAALAAALLLTLGLSAPAKAAESAQLARSFSSTFSRSAGTEKTAWKSMNRAWARRTGFGSGAMTSSMRSV